MSSILTSESFVEHIHGLLDKFHVPGMAIATVDGQDIQCKGFGLATIDPPQPVTSETIFDAASTSKSLTAAAVALLVEDPSYAQLQWESTMSSLLPEDFVMSDPALTSQVTVEDILSHRSGLPRHDLSYLGVHAQHPDSPRSITRNLRHLPTNRPLRTTYQYCNIMFTVAVHLLETVTGSSFITYLQEKLLDPLGMSSTFLQPSAVFDAGLSGRLATHYVWKDGRFQAQDFNEQPESPGAGGIQSTAVDYAKWIRAMLHRSGPVTSSVYEALVQPRIITDADVAASDLEPFTSHELYGLGWSIVSYRGAQIINHDGLDGCGSAMFFLPEHDFGAYMVGNAPPALDLAAAIMHELVDALLEVPMEQRTDWAGRALEREAEAEDEKDEETDEDEEPRRTEMTMPRESYVGRYHNDGYRSVVVQEKNDALFIDARDRGMQFEVTLEHLRDNTDFTGHFDDLELEKYEISAAFRVEGGEVKAMGLQLEPAMGDGYLIWFDRAPAA